MKARFLTATVGAGLLAGAVTFSAQAAPPSPAPTRLSAGSAVAATALTCRAAVSYPRPHAGMRETLTVTTAARAQVVTNVHYKTRNTALPVTSADARGSAVESFGVGRPTRGFQVVVSVQVTSAGRLGYCSTSFVPR
jgi:Spy/CpxP family protein refolding chaperone